ncbi:unnamed protein product [Peronospora belbahrii]|nr:unnamed protein product [Peronospora belbahrii]
MEEHLLKSWLKAWEQTGLSTNPYTFGFYFALLGFNNKSPDELLQSPELSTLVAFGKLLNEDEQNKWKDVLLDKLMSKEPDLPTLKKIFAKHSNGINAEAVRVLKLRLLEKIKEEKLD